MTSCVRRYLQFLWRKAAERLRRRWVGFEAEAHHYRRCDWCGLARDGTRAAREICDPIVLLYERWAVFVLTVDDRLELIQHRCSYNQS